MTLLTAQVTSARSYPVRLCLLRLSQYAVKTRELDTRLGRMTRERPIDLTLLSLDRADQRQRVQPLGAIDAVVFGQEHLPHDLTRFFGDLDDATFGRGRRGAAPTRGDQHIAVGKPIGVTPEGDVELFFVPGVRWKIARPFPD